MIVKKIIGILIGLGCMALSVMAYFSNEPASKTDFGRITTIGVSILMGNLSSKKTITPIQPTLVIPLAPKCPACGKEISNEFSVCPYCATVLKPKCPSCGKEVTHDFKNCPYCGTVL